MIATDFRADPAASSASWSSTSGLGPARAGALTQRLLEIETYRTLALLGLPEAQMLAPRVKTIEDSLTRISKSMNDRSGLETDHKLLDELTALAARDGGRQRRESAIASAPAAPMTASCSNGSL